MLRVGLKSQRKQNFQQRLKVAELLFQKANKLCQLNLCDEAIDCFELSISVFNEGKVPKRWEDTHWEDLTVHRMQNTEEEQLKNIRLKTFHLLAECYQRVGNPPASIKVCDYILNLDEQSVKGMLKRARARLLVDGVSEIDFRLAASDLQYALTLDGQDKEVQKELQRVEYKLKDLHNTQQGQGAQKSLAQKQQELIEQFKRTTPQMYESDSDMSSDYDDEMDKFSTDLEGYDYELSYEQDPNKPVPVEVSELGKFIETRGLEMVKIYEQTGRRKEADELKEKLKKALTAKKQLEKISQLDFNRPKKKLQEIAQKFGIDLYDPTVQNEFKKIQQQNLEDIRVWLQQNQWNYSIVEESSQSAIPPIDLNINRRRQRGQARHKSKFNKKSPVTINNNISYHVHNNPFSKVDSNMEQNEFKQMDVMSNNDEQEDVTINCSGLINNLIVLLALIAIVSTLYYSFIR